MTDSKIALVVTLICGSLLLYPPTFIPALSFYLGFFVATCVPAITEIKEFYLG